MRLILCNSCATESFSFAPGFSWSRRNPRYRHRHVHHHEDGQEMAFCGDFLILWHLVLFRRDFRGKWEHAVA